MVKRRNFLIFLGGSIGTVAIGCAKTSLNQRSVVSTPNQVSPTPSSPTNLPSFQPIKGPMPLPTDNLEASKQTANFTTATTTAEYATYEVVDDLVLPEGFTYDVIAAWGDKIGDSRCGYNNDYLSFVETAPNEGLLTINFEYISSKTWMETYSQVIGKDLPLEEVKAALAEKDGVINAFALADDDPLKLQIQVIAKEGLTDLGFGVISLRQDSQGKWIRTNSKLERRTTGISGLEDGNYLKATGAAVAVFKKANKLGYEDNLGEKIIGSFQNCAGGTTPWGTVLSAEENFQTQVPDPVKADGSSFDPSENLFSLSDKDLSGLANVFGLAGNKYGWMVEIDPANSQDYGTKHTWLGRYRHEAVGIRAEAGKKLAVYSGCDRRGGHVYKFISQDKVTNPQDKANSRLFADGMLYGAKFYPDGTGSWIALTPSTPVNPVLPSQVEGKGGEGMVTLPNPNRRMGGVIKVVSDGDALNFKQTFATLGDIYDGNAVEKQGAILIDAHYAANAAGITCTARPEDTEIALDGSLYIAFTSGSPGGDGGPDERIFKGPKGETPWEYGWIVRIVEEENNPEAITFKWEVFAMGGEPADGGAGFSNPDNLEFDKNGNLWMVTDMSTSKHNKALPQRLGEDGKSLGQTAIQGIFGNNSMWFMPTSGQEKGNAFLFATGPMECETTGPLFTKDGKTLFLSVQHPGEKHGTRKTGQLENREFALKTFNGEEFVQKRQVPLGSNWPSKVENDAPRPAVVAIRRLDSGILL